MLARTDVKLHGDPTQGRDWLKNVFFACELFFTWLFRSASCAGKQDVPRDETSVLYGSVGEPQNFFLTFKSKVG